MQRKRYRTVWLAVYGLIVVVVGALGAAGHAQNAAPAKYPPQFPREGATKLFENDQIIVWEQVGRPKEPYVHSHVRDTLVFSIENGRVETRTPDGQKTDGKAEGAATTRIYPGTNGIGSLVFTKAGLGPHVEIAPDPDSVPKSIYVELKGTEPKDCGRWSTACP
jgi:hypothetical protein